MNTDQRSASSVTDEEYASAVAGEAEAYNAVRLAQFALRHAEDAHHKAWKHLNGVKAQLVAEIKEKNRVR